MKLTQRDIPPRSLWALEQAGVHPLLARLYAARGVTGPEELDPDLAHLLPLQALKGAQPAAVLLADAIERQDALCIVAARITDQWHRPTFVFAASQADGKGDELKGSGRSLPGFHLRDALDLISKRHPGVLLRFGGHAMAAGCTIHADHIDVFESALQQVAQEWLDEATLQRRLDTDGPLLAQFRRVELVEQINSEVWGQGFAAPTFCEEMDVVSQRLVGEKHLSLRLRHQGDVVDAIWFGRSQPLAARAKLAYRVETDAWQGQTRVRFVIEAAQD